MELAAIIFLGVLILLSLASGFLGLYMAAGEDTDTHDRETSQRVARWGFVLALWNLLWLTLLLVALLLLTTLYYVSCDRHH